MEPRSAIGHMITEPTVFLNILIAYRHTSIYMVTAILVLILSLNMVYRCRLADTFFLSKNFLKL